MDSHLQLLLLQLAPDLLHRLYFFSYSLFLSSIS